MAGVAGAIDEADGGAGIPPSGGGGGAMFCTGGGGGGGGVGAPVKPTKVKIALHIRLNSTRWKTKI